MEYIKEDTEDRKRRDEEQAAENEAKEAKIKERMSMDDAARYIQRRWEWFQTEGKFLAKKGKKGRKGKKKKKKWSLTFRFVCSLIKTLLTKN